MDHAEVGTQDIDALIVSTCTGYLCPGLTSYVSERLRLAPDLLLLDLVGQGCGAALPNLRTAEALLASGRAERVLSICVEVQDVSCWIMHGGGRSILEAVRGRLGLTEQDLRWSAAVLREYGMVGKRRTLR